MAALLQWLFVPLMLLNIFGGLVSGVWLAIKGEWGILGYGFLSMLISTFVIGLALMPHLLISSPAIWFMNRGMKSVAFFFILLGNLYLYALITIWCGGALWFFINKAHYDILIPVLIWSYGVALEPWSYMASKDQQSEGGFSSAMTTIFIQVGYALMMIMILFFRPTFIDVMEGFVVVMIIGLITSAAVAGLVLRETPA